jgi:hypothetical protein
MKRNRLENVLTRNRKHLVLDVALAAFFLMTLLFSGLAFGAELPKLSMAAKAAPAELTPVSSASAGVPDGLEPEAASPQLAQH